MSKDSALKLATTPSATPAAPVVAAVAQPPAGATTIDTPQAAAPAHDNRLDIIIKKETQIFKDREQLKKAQAEATESKRQSDEIISRVRAFEDKAKTSKVDALKMLGWTDTDIINLINADKPNAPTAEEIAAKVADEKVKGLDDKWTQKEKKAQEDRDAQEISTFRGEIGSTLKSEASKYKYAASEGREAELQAWAIILQNLKATATPENPSGEVLTIGEALEITDEYYKMKYESKRKLFEEPKVQIETPEAPAKPAGGTFAGRAPVSNTPQPPKTLTNAVAPTSRAAATTTTRETPEAKRARLADMIRGSGFKR